MTDEDDIKAVQKILKESTGINFKMPTEIIHSNELPTVKTGKKQRIIKKIIRFLTKL